MLAQSKPLTVLVAGDPTGTAVDEWQALWGRALTSERAVRIRQSDSASQEFADAATPVGGTGPKLTIWNLSQPGAAADFAAAHLPQVGAKPDLVLFDRGRNTDAGEVGPPLDTTLDAVEARWGDVPGVVALTQPAARVRDAPDPSARGSRLWAEAVALTLTQAP